MEFNKIKKQKFKSQQGTSILIYKYHKKPQHLPNKLVRMVRILVKKEKMGGHGPVIIGNQSNIKEEDADLSSKIRPIELIKHNP